MLIRLLAENIERIDGIEFFVAQELENIAVKLVAARLDDGVHDRAVATAELGAVRICLYFEFRDRIHRWLNHIGRAVEHVAKIGVVVDAIELKVVLQ